MRSSVWNCPHSGGSTSRAKTTAPSLVVSSVGVSAAYHSPSCGPWPYEDRGGGDRSASGNSRRAVNSMRTSAGLRPLSMADALFPVRQGARPAEVVGGEFQILMRGRQIQPLRVVKQHTPHVEARDHGHHRALHALHPAGWAAGLVAPVVKRQYLFLECAEDHIGLERVATFGVLHARRRYAPAVVLLPPFRPPAIEDAQVKPAVDGRLDAGGAARLERRDRVVQ